MQFTIALLQISNEKFFIDFIERAFVLLSSLVQFIPSLPKDHSLIRFELY